jgi:hypothetical protein
MCSVNALIGRAIVLKRVETTLLDRITTRSQSYTQYCLLYTIHTHTHQLDRLAENIEQRPLQVGGTLAPRPLTPAQAAAVLNSGTASAAEMTAAQRAAAAATTVSTTSATRSSSASSRRRSAASTTQIAPVTPVYSNSSRSSSNSSSSRRPIGAMGAMPESRFNDPRIPRR